MTKKTRSSEIFLKVGHSKILSSPSNSAPSLPLWQDRISCTIHGLSWRSRSQNCHSVQISLYRGYAMMVTFVAVRLQCPRFKPRPGQKFEMRFLLHAHPDPLLGPRNQVSEQVPRLETQLKSE